MGGASGFILFELGGKMGSFGKVLHFPFLGSFSFVLALRDREARVCCWRRGAILASR
jgi:hypothetical protein